MIKRSSNVEGCGQTVKRPFSPSVNGQEIYSFDEPLAHAQYTWVKGSRGVVKKSRLIFGRSSLFSLARGGKESGEVPIPTFVPCARILALQSDCRKWTTSSLSRKESYSTSRFSNCSVNESHSLD